MSLERTAIHCFRCFAALLLLIAGNSAGALELAKTLQAASQKVLATCEGIEVDSDELTSVEAEKYCRYAVSERKKVEKFWGPTWKEKIRIQVSSAYVIASALLTNQGNPGRITVPLDRVKDMQGGLLHEITHNYAPNSNRFLEEGLAVYLQEKLGGNPSFPNFHRDLHALAAVEAASVKSLANLIVKFPQPPFSVMGWGSTPSWRSAPLIFWRAPSCSS